jgi:hypothetical protein
MSDTSHEFSTGVTNILGCRETPLEDAKHTYNIDCLFEMLFVHEA